MKAKLAAYGRARDALVNAHASYRDAQVSGDEDEIEARRLALVKATSAFRKCEAAHTAEVQEAWQRNVDDYQTAKRAYAQARERAVRLETNLANAVRARTPRAGRPLYSDQELAALFEARGKVHVAWDALVAAEQAVKAGVTPDQMEVA